MKVKGTESWPNKEDTLALVLGSAKFSHMRELAEDQLVGEAVGSVGVRCGLLRVLQPYQSFLRFHEALEPQQFLDR